VLGAIAVEPSGVRSRLPLVPVVEPPARLVVAAGVGGDGYCAVNGIERVFERLRAWRDEPSLGQPPMTCLSANL
jgi:hypothetical protein